MTVAQNCLACGAPIAQPPGSGRRRRWCGDACRSRGRRASIANFRALVCSLIGGRETPAKVGAALAALSDGDFALPDSPDEAVLESLAEAHVLAEKFRRVAAVARPEVAALCDELGDDLAAALEHFFAPEAAVRVTFSATDEAAQAQ
jgi:hypothetical protein